MVGSPPPSASPAPVARGHLAYRPALDGIRAVAVVAVLVFHGGVEFVPGGFLGVDVFFVLSGYLITTLLVNEAEQTGRIDLAAFYRRRFRRLMPALVVLLLTVAGYAAVARTDWSTLAADGIASLLYVPNWHFIRSGQSYFDQFASPSPLRHLWSLGIEEQWYLVWPVALVLLVGVAKCRRGVMVVVCAGLAAASAVWMAILSTPDSDPSRAYYGTDTRAQGLLIGAALAFALPAATRLLARRARWVASSTAALGLAVICALMVVATDGDQWLYEGGFTAVSLATAVLVAGVSMHPDSLPARVLSAGIPRAIGRVSYGLYLWHWPVFVVMQPGATGANGPALLAARIAVTLALTLVSYRLIEQPVRRGSLPRLGFAGVASAGVAAALFLVPAAPPIGPSELASTAGAVDQAAAASVSREEPRGAPRARPLRVLVVGDSVGLTLAVHFDGARHAGVTVRSAAQLGCGVGPGRPVIGGRAIEVSEECTTWRERWAAGAADGPDVVLMVVGAWEVADQKVDGRVLKTGTSAAASALADQLSAGIAAVGDRPVVVTTVPCFHEESRELGGATSPRNDPKRVAWVNDVIAGVVARHPNTTTADLAGYLCGSGGTSPRGADRNMRHDGVHFTPAGADEVWHWLLPQLRAAISTAQ